MKVEVLYEKAPVSGAILYLSKKEVESLRNIIHLAYRGSRRPFYPMMRERRDIDDLELFVKALQEQGP